MAEQSDALEKMSHADLIAMVRRLTEQNLGIAREIQTRALPSVGEMTDALNAFSLNAKAGSATAKEMLKQLFEAFDGARAASEGLDVVRKGGPPILLRKS